MKIVKYDEQDPDIRLEGVHFNLYTTSDRLVGEGKTDAQGHLVFDGIINRDYVLKEVANLEGYLLPKKTIKVQFNEERIFELEVGNRRNQLSILKRDEKGNKFEGARFEIIKDAKETLFLESDANGEMKLDRLADGHYVLKERKAHPDYILNTETVQFDVIDHRFHQDGKIDDELKIDFVNYQGEVLFTKTGHEGHVLSNVRYGFYRKEGKQIQEVMTDEKVSFI